MDHQHFYKRCTAQLRNAKKNIPGFLKLLYSAARIVSFQQVLRNTSKDIRYGILRQKSGNFIFMTTAKKSSRYLGYFDALSSLIINDNLTVCEANLNWLLKKDILGKQSYHWQIGKLDKNTYLKDFYHNKLSIITFNEDQKD